LYYFLQTSKVVQAIRSTATGTMVRHTAPSRILANIVQLPSRYRQQLVVERLDSLRSEVRKLEIAQRRKLAALAELKQSLLARAFSGELTATDALAA
jgi:type I restriction enzyme, S subunit